MVFSVGARNPRGCLADLLGKSSLGSEDSKESHATRVLSWALAEALANHRTPREALGIAGRVFGVRPEQLQIGGQGIVSMEQLSSSTQQEIISVA